MRMRTTPDQMRRPASVTTNDGTPGLRDHERLDEADRGRAEEGDADREPTRASPGRRDAGGASSRRRRRRSTKATDRSISPMRSTKTTPIAIVAIAAIWSRRFVKLRSVRKVSSSRPKMTTMTTRPTMIGSDPSSPAWTPCHQRADEAGERLLPGPRPARRPRVGGSTSADCGGGIGIDLLGHASAASAASMPGHVARACRR